MSAGGIHESTPPPVAPPVDFSEPSSYHSGSKRGSRDQVVTSPEKKKSFGVGEYFARLSESIAARNTPRERERTREQVKVDEVMAILRSDGVPRVSPLFFEAMELFKNSVSRRLYKNLEDAEERIAWLQWHLDRNKK
jgi:hypothetical protein